MNVRERKKKEREREKEANHKRCLNVENKLRVDGGRFVEGGLDK